MIFAQSMESRGNTLSGPDHSRMELLSVLTGLWNRELSLCFTRLVSLSHSGVKLLAAFIHVWNRTPTSVVPEDAP